MNKLTRLVLVLAFFLASAGINPAAAGAGLPRRADEPPQPDLPQTDHRIFLPMLTNIPQYRIYGQVRDANNLPIAGVTVTSDKGEAAVTNAAGSYILPVYPGPVTIAAAKTGLLFSPSMLEIYVTGSLTNQNFLAVADCAEAIVNGGFEANTWWNFPASGIPADYSTAVPHSGSRSVRTGIVNSWQNALVESRVRSPLLTLPANTTTAVLRLWLYPLTSETPLTGIETAAEMQKFGLETMPAAPEASTPSETAFGDTTLLYDAQYVRVLDENNVVIGTLMYIRSNNAWWSFHQFDLTPFAGRTIRLEIGTYNDGSDGVTAMYVDDVSLTVCASGPPPPPPPSIDTCANQVANSGFEYNGSWNLPNTPYPAGYSYDTAHAGARSMRTGIPLYTGSNVLSYSDAWQTIYIPPVSSNVRLKMWLYPRSTETAASAGPAAPEAAQGESAPEAPIIEAGAPESGQVWNDTALAPDAPDAQYVLLLNPTTGTILRTLEWWTPRNASGWIYKEYDLSAYAGQNIRIQFGTYNDGYNGRTVMYADEVRLEVCSATPPPPTCSERIGNNGFENNTSWYIPYTAFSAGYSTWLRHSGARSMRTGIVYGYHNRYSYSDVRQTVTIPAGTRNATLRFFAYSMSGEIYSGVAESERPTAAEQGTEAMAGDVQYVLVLDRWGNWIDTLVWRRSNESYWRSFSFSLNRYIGSTIMLQFGTYNNGYDGVTSMYIDDVTLTACP